MKSKSQVRGEPRTLRRRLAIIPMALLGLLLLVPGIVAAQQANEVDIPEITDSLNQYEGEQVTVTAEVAEVIEPTAIVKSENGFVGVGGSDLLVMAELDRSMQVEEGREVRTTGRVGIFDFDAFQREIGDDLSDTVYPEWDGRAVLVVMSIEPADNDDN